jgi:Fe-S cluster assembly iron-binding protein IscA
MHTKHKKHLVAGAALAVLAACGGGGGSNPTDNETALKLSGTAATGLAIANAPVEAKCASGTGTATTSGDGTYTLTIEGGSLPCVLQVAPGGGEPLRSLIDGSGAGEATVNITPLTELIAAKAAGGDPAALFDNFDAAAQAKVSTAAVQEAVQAVVVALQGVIDLAGVDPIKDTLVAATSGGGTGNELDQKLDALQAALAAAQTTLAEVTTAVATSGSTAAPVQTILQPAASGCAGFRSGIYVAMNPAETDSEWAVHKLTLDAANLRATFHDNTSVDFTDDGNCAYSVPDDGVSTSKILVTKAGLAIGRDTYTSGAYAGKTDVSVIVPLQAIPLSELAGTWNWMEYLRDTGMTSFAASRGVMAIAADGRITSGSDCNSAGTCQDWTPTEGDAFRVHSEGGFLVGDDDPAEPASRAFAFKSAGGHLSMFVLLSNNRGMAVLTKQKPQSLPEVGTVTKFWDFQLLADGFANAVLDTHLTVTAVNAETRAFTRIRQSDSRVDTQSLDNPDIGLRSRVPNSCTVDGAARNCAGVNVLPLPGTGLVVSHAIAPQNFFGISVIQP